ncbi:MAG: insulinase family protein [Blautia sp.]|jgi:Zn-dependent M16 (insulinase) family peptidase
MKIEQIPAYELIRKEELSDIQSVGYLLRHKKTKAKVMLIENEDENKVFDITFRTPPGDSTGVAHILEHSVLCGSKEFPLKDPFVELVKGSLNTFLNAMTYPDKTTYPVASCNDQDFQNLMHVYLDAVFYPNVYEREEIFRQEGWSYHLEEPEGELTYNGVVYNEMKGVFSSPDEVLERRVMDQLFPDTTYGKESGGDPDCIPELTYEEFLDFHRKYYHPSNSFFYLYGNMDMTEKLAFIDERYLSRFDYLEVDSAIDEQAPFSARKDLVMEYPVSETESLEGNAYLSYNVVAGSTMDTKLCTAFEVLDYALLSAPGAPLKKALLDAGIGKDIYGGYNDGILQPYFTITAKGADENQKDEFFQVIKEVLENLTVQGIDQKALEAGINFYEFQYREADFASYPKGLMYGLNILDNWLYSEEEPFAQVQLLKVFEELREEISSGYFERLVESYLLENPHSLLMTLVPKRGMTTKKDQETAKKLAAYKESLTKEQREELCEKTKALAAYQEAEESEEALQCIPMLSRSDIKRGAGEFYNKEERIGETLFLHHDVCTNGIGYLNLLFPLKEISAEMVPYAGLLKSVLGYVDTEHFSYGELFHEINASTGGILCGIEVYDRTDSQEFLPVFGIRAKALYRNLDFVYRMIEEILDGSKLDDTKRLGEIVSQLKSRAQASLVSAGHSTAVLRASSYASPMAEFQDRMGGIAFYRFLEGLEANFQERKEELSQKLLLLMRQVFRPENLMVDFTGEQEGYDQVKTLTEAFKGKLCHAEVEKERLVIHCTKKNEGFQTSGQVQYVAQAGNFKDAGFAYTGALSILKVILGYDYLWSQIRVQGGAYGCMSGFKRNGESFFVSYRDPNLKRTLEVYQGIPEYLRKFSADERDMTKYIIGTISNLDVPRTPKTKGAVSRVAYFSGITPEMVQKERDQILNATAEDIRALAPLMEAILAKEQICVVGGEEALEQEKELFMEIKHLNNDAAEREQE